MCLYVEWRSWKMMKTNLRVVRWMLRDAYSCTRFLWAIIELVLGKKNTSLESKWTTSFEIEMQTIHKFSKNLLVMWLKGFIKSRILAFIRNPAETTKCPRVYIHYFRLTKVWRFIRYKKNSIAQRQSWFRWVSKEKQRLKHKT